MFPPFRHGAWLCALCLPLGLAASGRAQVAVVSDSVSEAAAAQSVQPTPPSPRVVKLTLHPAAAPVPAMKYMLLPEVRDLRPGNAALLYQRSNSPEWWSNFMRSPEFAKMGDYLDMPMRKMPREKVIVMSSALREVDLAARREFCDWELTPRLRDDGPFLLLPDIQSFRTSGVQLALRARLEMLDGNYDKAVYSMQTSMALGRHVGEAPTLISSLVGMAIAGVTLKQVEEFVQLEKSPNLYWALADLPRPLFDLRKPLQGEKLFIESMFPGVREALRDPKAPPLATAVFGKHMSGMQALGIREANPFMLALIAARAHPAAKKYLLTRGFTAEQVEALPVVQASMMLWVANYDEYFDDAYRWQAFPYWEARPQLKKASERLKQSRADHVELNLFATLLLPATERVFFAKARAERNVALLQTIEALRLHAAANDGNLPDTLADVRAVPVPQDPVTGRPFDYALAEGLATLYAPPPPGEVAHEGNSVRYELTMKK